MYGASYLFMDGSLNDFLRKRKDSAIREINDLNSNYILNVSDTDFSDYLVEKYTLKPPVLQEDKINSYCEEVELGISKGTKITLYIPFDGDSFLFKYTPSTYFTSGMPEGTLKDQEVHIFFSFEGSNKTAEYIKSEFNKQISKIKSYLEWVEKDVKPFNNALSRDIESQIMSRREKLLRDSSLVSALGFRLRERSEMPVTYTVPTIRKSIHNPPKASTENFVPEPTLDLENYEHVLSVVNNMTQVMERSPKAFKNMDEEAIRQHFLVQLNGHYEGQATGETFNFNGKTDILIRTNGKNIFIAECKFWKGADVLKETIDQILGYLSWRDTKAAIFIFNKNKDLSKVLSQIPETVKEHPNFKREIEYKSETGFRFMFGHNNDSNREIYLTILVFDVPS
jgi:hypothetical protein